MEKEEWGGLRLLAPEQCRQLELQPLYLLVWEKYCVSLELMDNKQCGYGYGYLKKKTRANLTNYYG